MHSILEFVFPFTNFCNTSCLPVQGHLIKNSHPNQDLRDRLRLFDGLFVVEKKISLVVNDAAQKLCTT
ncbi:MAG: hypothetical protein LBQ43_03165, partial [Holosporales bacterium]|nr:hypothetical protein [Holosporales bacterium]